VQLKQGDFGGAAIAYWKNYRPEATSNVNLRPSLATEAFQKSTAWKTRGALLRAQGYLAAMRVTAKNQIYAGPGSASKNNWIVRKQKLHLVRAASSQRQRKILLAHHGVVNAGKPKRAPVQFETHSFVYKDTNSFSPEKISNKRGVCPMIMVAQDCKHPMPSP